MKVVAISDTHGQHKRLQVPYADMILHAGDVSRRGTIQEVADFLKWYALLPHPYKIFVPGNHDFFFENATQEEIHAVIPSGVIYLNDTGILIEGIRIWGSPIQPYFHNWAFNRQRGHEIKAHWDLIPEGTDILITHGPAADILDKTWAGQHVGCEDLKQRIGQVKPSYHIFGHIHEAYGCISLDNVSYINACVLDLKYKLVNEPVVFEIIK